MDHRIQSMDEEEEEVGGVREEERGGGGEVYCAVGKDAGKEWKANLRWVLANFPRRRRLVLVHIHRPPRRINMMGAWVPVSQLADEEVAVHTKLAEDKTSTALDDLLHACSSQQVQARKLIVSGDDAASGLVRLLDDHAVADLVVGAASDRAYSRRMRAPRSKKALTLHRKANPSTRIWFLCKGNLICTREGSEGQSRAGSSSSTGSMSPRSSDCSRSRSSSAGTMQQEFSDLTLAATLRRNPSRDDDDDNDDASATDRSVDDEATAAADVAAGPSTAPTGKARKESPPPEVEVDPPTPSRHGSSDNNAGGEMDDEDVWCQKKLRDALMEADNLRHEAREETRRRQKAERDLDDASRMANDAESSYQGEAKSRKEMEERLARERAAMEQDRRELDAILQKIQEANDRSDKLEVRIADSERMMSELDVRKAESYSVLEDLRRDRRREDPAAAAAAESTSATDGSDQCSLSFLRLGLTELEEATNRFDESVRIAAGVYRGKLRGMSVAVKVIGADVAVDEVRFAREVEAISRVEHPNLVKLVGACPEARAVVHEFVPGGSLEDRLGGGGGAPPLPWHARCGVAYQICSALAFLHSTRATVHGDVRPANILLVDDEQGSTTSKVAGLGTRGLTTQERAPLVGETLAYTDPWYLATGELTPHSDVHALGLVLLRLVTGRRAFAAMKAAKDAAVSGSKSWHDVADTSAGGWPTERAKEVSLLGLKLCAVHLRRRHPPAAGELLNEARSVLETAMSAAPGRTWSSLSSECGSAPSYFLCPILKEVMRDPQIAGDGFSYEGEAMREWLRSGHDTSPMTNLKLPTDELIPNHALRAAIQEWRHTRPTTTSSSSSS